MKRCFIIGNGPSQNNVDLSLLKDETTFGMNGIHLRFPDFYPVYWAVLDPYYFKNYRDIITDWDSHPCVVLGSEKFHDFPQGRFERIHVYGNTKELMAGKVAFWGDHKWQVYSTGNVGYACMQIAWWKGFRELNIIGVDSDTMRPKLENHFHPDYGDRLEDPNVRARGFAYNSEIWSIGYRHALEWIEERGGKIWDVSDSPLNIFPKRSFDEAIV